MACKICGPKLSLCGLVLSVWGIIQLTLMGIFYYIGAVALLEDIPIGENHHSIEDFIADVKKGYLTNSYNCWIAALLYVVTLVFSGHQFWMNNRSSVSIFVFVSDMSLLYGCGLCCFLLSIWAVLQLVVMGVFFKLEVLAFIEEAEPDHHGYEDYDDFMKQTKDNYHKIAINCWIAAVIYLVSMGLSYFCIAHANKKSRLAAEKGEDDEAFCRAKAKKNY